MVGRRPTGVNPGEKVSDYRRFAVRLPEDVRAELEAAAGALRRPAWRVVVDAIRAYVGSGPALSDEERRAVRVVARLHEK
jgi:predicted transcriptional regulator